jgi:predicted ABC-type ATPase
MSVRSLSCRGSGRGHQVGHDAGRPGFAFETVMSHESKLELLGMARKQGYRHYLYFVTAGDPAINVERVHQRIAEGGHPVEDDKIIDRYKRCMALLPNALKASDRAYLFDNSGTDPILVASVMSGSVVTLESHSIPFWVGNLLRDFT